MRIVLLTGNDRVGGPEHRYLAEKFREAFGAQLVGVIVAEAPAKPVGAKIRRAWRRYDLAGMSRRVARAAYQICTLAAQKRQVATAKHLFAGCARVPRPLLDQATHLVNDHNAPESLALLDQLKPDIIAVYGTKIIKPTVLAKAGIETLNLHTGLSPYYRGDSTTFWPLYFGDTDQLGVTVHRLAAAVDGGDIIATGVTPFVHGDDEASLFAKAVVLGTDLYIDAIRSVYAGTAQFVPQSKNIGREFRNVERTVAAELRVQWNLWRGLRQNGTDGTPLRRSELLI